MNLFNSIKNSSIGMAVVGFAIATLLWFFIYQANPNLVPVEKPHTVTVEVFDGTGKKIGDTVVKTKGKPERITEEFRVPVQYVVHRPSTTKVVTSRNKRLVQVFNHTCRNDGKTETRAIALDKGCD